MNNHSGYSSPGFPSYGRRHPNSSELPARGPRELPNQDTQDFSRNERQRFYCNSFREETSLGFNDSSPLDARQTFSNEDMNSYRQGPRQYRHSRDDIFSAGRLSQIDQRTLLQSAPRTSFLNEALNQPYSSIDKLNPKMHPSYLKQNQSTTSFNSESYSNISRNAFSKEDVPYGNLSPSGSFSNMQKLNRDFLHQSGQTFSEPHSHFEKISSSPVYSKNSPFSNSRNFSEVHSPDTGYPHNSLSSRMSYFENNSFNHHEALEQDKRIASVLEEQRSLKENKERISSPIISSSIPTNVDSNSLDNLQSTLSSSPGQLLTKEMSWYRNTMDIEKQSEILNKTEILYSESSQPTDNVIQDEFTTYSQASAVQIFDSNVSNFRESNYWNNSLESQNSCLTPEKMTVVHGASHKMSSDFIDACSNETIATNTFVETRSQMPITLANNAMPLNVDKKVDKFSTKDELCKNSQNFNENSFSSNKLSETSIIETNIPLFGEPLNKNSLDKHLESSATYVTNPSENLALNELISSDLSNKSFDSKNSSSNLDKSVLTNKSQKSNSLCLENSLSEPQTTEEHSLFLDEKVSSTDWSKTVPISLDNLNKCLEIMKNYSPLLTKDDEVKSKPLFGKSNSNEGSEAVPKVSPNSVESINSPNSALIPFLNESNDAQSITANVNAKQPDDLPQGSESSDAPSFKSVISSSRETPLKGSALEHALATLEVNSPVVGLDYIVEDKNSLSMEGRFPFKCKLCNSSIARTLILDHIQGSKHRLRYLKIKDEATYDQVMRQKDPDIDKDVLICELAKDLEQKHGRGRVVVLLDSSFKGIKKVPPVNIQKVCHDLIDVDFESTHKPDVKNLTTESVVEKKLEEQVTLTVAESITKLVEDNSSSSSRISSCSADLPKQNSEMENELRIVSQGISDAKTNAKDVTEGFVIDKLSDAECLGTLSAKKQTNLLADSPLAEKFSIGNLTAKRSASPYDDEAYKSAKRQHVKNLNMDWNSTDSSVQSNPEPPLNKNLSAAQTTNSNTFNPLILEQLSKCEISSEDEAGIVLQTVDVLLKLLLQYKLKDNSNIDVENLMRSLHNKPPEELIKALGFLKGNVSTTNILKEEKPAILSEDNSNSLSGHQTENQNLSQNNCSMTNNQTVESGKQFLDSSKSELTPTSVNASQSSNSRLLQPPPFFRWPSSNNATISHDPPSVTSSQTVQNDMTWSSAYQSSVAYYQQHGYTVPAMYQTYGIPMVPSIPSATMPLVAPVQPVVPPTIMAPLPPIAGATSVPLPPPLPPPPPPSEPPPLPK